MRIALVIYGSLDEVSGGFLYDRRLVEYLRDAGHQVEVIGLPWRDYPRHLLHNFSGSLLRRLSNPCFDILLQDELNHPSLFWFNRRLRPRSHTPIVSIVHHLRFSENHPAVLRLLYRIVERAYLESVDGFIFNSRTTHDSVSSLIGSIDSSVVAYPAGTRFKGLPQSSIRQRAAQQRPLQVMFLGNIIPRKGLDTLLEGMACLPDSSAVLNIVGSREAAPDYVRSIEHKINRLGLAQQVTFTGRLSDDKLAAQLAGSDVMAVPSQYEGFGIVYLEGMAFGLPAIATTAGGAVELVTDGQNGFLIPPGDASALASKLQTLADNRDRLRAMSIAARRRFEEHPTWEESMSRARQYIEQVAEGHKEKRCE